MSIDAFERLPRLKYLHRKDNKNQSQLLNTFSKFAGKREITQHPQHFPGYMIKSKKGDELIYLLLIRLKRISGLPANIWG
ncbi:MAG: hypothetical protein O8C66_00975 [Candidatus Methanoperedens sp.]|nr:hypothetical protein [Candidatus Methanoperedens sp.]MCZ7369061.1 hypothetical protein [Candidatus Methanoperedens sp.]